MRNMRNMINMRKSSTASEKTTLISAVVIAVLAGMILVAYKAHNPGDGAEHHFSRNNKLVYWVIRLCCAGLAAASMFNARFVAGKLGRAILIRSGIRLPTIVERALRPRVS